MQNFLKQFKPKKYKAYNKYVIVSAVYNVEKYLDDFFKSVIKQRLDFKNNILIILVDDGSTDNSANIIKKYQKNTKKILSIYTKKMAVRQVRGI
ncbi:glycosyltransferase [Campylobacter jejuni]|nr:glycosyltransferase [Campylobacter jejuni]